MTWNWMKGWRLLLAGIAVCLHAQETPKAPTKTNEPLPTLAQRTEGLQHQNGFLPLHWDARHGHLYLEIGRIGQELLYTDSLPYGTGSNDLGLDRGQTSPARLVRFERQGAKVLLVERNTFFRTSATEPAEVLATRQSFPESVLWGFPVEAESANGAVLVDATDFALQDVHHVAEALARTQQGSYKVDSTRSAIAISATKAFERNTEIESILTFTSEGAPRGRFVRDVTPDPHALTVRERHSFIALPEPGFTPRPFDPRAGYFDLDYRDYHAALGDELDRRLIERHRLIKKDPACRTACEPVTPIVYYVDRGAPEPIRSALVEGASWWNQAFTAAGWKDAFQVKVLPADADPMDVRYNIIQWVHRYTRGWSYGATVTDPRTGEILKGNVTLGSLRGRQGYLIAEALLAPYTGSHKNGFSADSKDDPMLAMVLARIRQLSAHETGHTLGLAHNFAASSYSQGASVMDYPHPLLELRDGVPDLTHAYATGIGEWDKVAINYGYRQFGNEAAGEERVALDRILAEAERKGLPYLTDEDARPLGSANPKAHLWDNGPDAVVELDHVLAVRSAALGRFGEGAIRDHVPLAQLEDTLVPLFLLHRYQTEAAAKLLGGLRYEYTLRGDGQPAPKIVEAAVQRKALQAVTRTLSPELLTLPESLLAILPPAPPGYPRSRESFASHTGLTFDPVAAAESAADLTLALLLEPERAARLVQYHARDPQSPTLDEVLEAIFQVSAPPARRTGMQGVVARAVEARAVEAVLRLAANPEAPAEVRGTARAYAGHLLGSPGSADTPEDAHLAEETKARIRLFLEHPEQFKPGPVVETPPGMPIGEEEGGW